MSSATSFLLLSLLCPSVLCVHKCVRVVGRVECARNPSVLDSTEISIYDKDVFVLDAWDPDDLMAQGHAGEDGRFAVEGCGGDVDWLPFWGEDGNRPEPFWTIHHFCGTDRGELFVGRRFHAFRPNVIDLGTIVLDEL